MEGVSQVQKIFSLTKIRESLEGLSAISWKGTSLYPSYHSLRDSALKSDKPCSMYDFEDICNFQISIATCIEWE